MNAALITNCTQRKATARATPARLAAAGGLTVEELASNWAAIIAHAPVAGRAIDIYQGRSMSEAAAAANHLNHELRILSAGLGLISQGDLIPVYDATVAGAGENTVSAVLGSRVTPSIWWHKLNCALGKTKPILSALDQLSGSLVIFAVSGTYLKLIQTELMEAVAEKRERFLLITGSPRSEFPTALQPNFVPYDSRFDGPDSPIPGTRSDFAQRAARHFIEAVYLKDPDAPCDVYRTRVLGMMESMRPAVRRTGRKLTDKEIRRFIDQYWDVVDGRSSEMLRFFRGYLGIACEQTRFARLFQEAKRARHPELEI